MKCKYAIGILLVILFISSCKDFIEPSIEDKKVILLAPADKQESNKYSQIFWWEPVEDALIYRLQIVSPSFDSIGYLVADTLVKADKFSFSLDPGRYEWRVRAENGSSKSLYTEQSFIIHLSSIKNQQVQLKSPGNNLVTNQQDITYKWGSIFGAGRYRLQIDTNNFSNENNVVFNNTTPNVEFTVPFTKEKVYQWRIRAESDTAQSQWSAIYKISYDNTPPAKVNLNSPANNQLISKPVTLQWNNVVGASGYQVLILKSDSTTAYSPGFPVTVTGTSYSFNQGDFNEKLYWKIRAVDEAGNIGVYSDLRNFIIQ